MRDLFSNIGARLALSPAVQTATVQGASIDTLNVQRIAFVVNTGAIAGSGVFGVTLQESDTGSSGWTDVVAAQLQSNAPATLLADASYKLGYLGHKRYVRLSLVRTSGTSIAAGATAILGDTAKRPVA